MSSSEEDFSMGEDSFLQMETVVLSSLTVPQLREKMRDAGEKNYSRLPKAKLIARLECLHSHTRVSEEEKSLSNNEEVSEKSQSEPSTGKRKMPDWNQPNKSSKRQKVAPPKPKVSVTRKKQKKEPLPSESIPLSLAFSSDEETENISSRTNSPKLTSPIPIPKPSLPTPSPILTNKWMKSNKKKITSTDLLDDLAPEISARSESDLLDALCDSKGKTEDSSILFEVSDSSDQSGEELPQSPIQKKTTHSSYLTSEDDEPFMLDSPKKAKTPPLKRKELRAKVRQNRLLSSDDDYESDGGKGTQNLSESPIAISSGTQVLPSPAQSDEEGGTQVLEDGSDSGGTQVLENSPCYDGTQVLPSSPIINDGGGTQVLASSPGFGESTQVLPGSNEESTQVLDQSMEEEGGGTQILASSPGSPIFDHTTSSSNTQILPSPSTFQQNQGETQVLDQSLEFGDDSSEFVGFGDPNAATDTNILSPTLPSQSPPPIAQKAAQNRRKKFQSNRNSKRNRDLSTAVESQNMDFDTPKLAGPKNGALFTSETSPIHKNTRPRPSAIPIESSFGNLEIAVNECSPTLALQDTPRFYFAHDNNYLPDPPSQARVGRLVPIYSSRPIIPIYDHQITLGKKQAPFDSRVDDAHCLLTVQQKRVLITDQSEHGTFINGVKLGKNTALLSYGDELSLTSFHKDAPCISYIYSK